MMEEQLEILNEFFDTYLRPFLTKALGTDIQSKRAIIILAHTAIEKTKPEFETLLRGCYPEDKQNLNAKNLRNCWIEAYNMFHASFSNTVASDLPKYINDTRFFGRYQASDQDISNHLKAYMRNWLKQYELEHSIIFSESLPSGLYTAAAQSDYNILREYFSNEDKAKLKKRINLAESFFGNTLLHFSLTAVGIFTSRELLKRTQDAFKCFVLILNNGADPNICNFNGKSPIDFCLEFLPLLENDIKPSQSDHFAKALLLYKRCQGKLPKNLISQLKQKGYNSVAREVEDNFEGDDLTHKGNSLYAQHVEGELVTSYKYRCKN